jgi:VWFA-related protein
VHLNLLRRRGALVILTAVSLVSAALATGARAQSPPSPSPAPPEKREVPTFGAATELVYVRFHVERKKGEYVDALKPDQVRVLEDGKPQTVALLETPATRERTVPPEVTLALDVSSSVMDAQLLDESLLREVLLATLGEQARVALCAFGGSLKCMTPPTRDSRALMNGFQDAIEFSHDMRNEGTRLYQSIADLAKPKPEADNNNNNNNKAQRALIVFSDGLDNKGGKMGDAVDAALASDVRVYTIALSQAFNTASRTVRPFGMPQNRTMYDYKKLDFGRLADLTGGRQFEPATLDEKALAKVLHDIATEIAMENVVGYAPEGGATGRKHKVKVELTDKSLGHIPDGERTLVR